MYAEKSIWLKKKKFHYKNIWQTSSRKGFTQSNVNSERLKTFSLWQEQGNSVCSISI